MDYFLACPYRVKLESPSWRLLMRLWRNRPCVVFCSARTISFAGTGITMVVLPVLVYGMTHSPAWVAALGLIEFVPYLSFGPLAGGGPRPSLGSHATLVG